MKRAPISREYVAALESQVESLEAFLADLKTSLPHVSIRDRAENSTHTVSSPIASQYLHGSISNVYLKSGQSLRTSYGYIPYSLSTSKILQYSNPKEHPQSHASSTTHDNDKLGQPFPRPLITECIALFFQWHYPDCMFVDRDEFLLGYLNHSHGGRHPSPGLEYAICALGALMSPEKNTRNLAEGFLSAAINSLDLLIANDASIQALLCCSSFQAGRGNFSQAWMLSGIAFRMLEEPGDVNNGNPGCLRSTSRDPRWRMFMNCYESDKSPTVKPGQNLMSD